MRCFFNWVTMLLSPAGTIPNTTWWFRKRPDLIRKYCLPGTGWNPGKHGYILAALNNISIAVEEMAVEAALAGDPRLVFQAVAYDPLAAAVLSLAEIKKTVQEMLRKNRNHLPQFKNIGIWA